MTWRIPRRIDMPLWWSVAFLRVESPFLRLLCTLVSTAAAELAAAAAPTSLWPLLQYDNLGSATLL